MNIVTGFGFKLDLQRKVLKVNGGEIVLNHHKGAAASMVLADGTKLMGRSEMIAPANLGDGMAKGRIVMLEPVIDNTQNRGLLVEKEVI